MNGIYREKKSSRELRRAGYASLRGYWGIAILAMLLASLLGASLTGGQFNMQIGFTTENEIEDETLTALFDLDIADTNGDGNVSFSELREVMPSWKELLTRIVDALNAAWSMVPSQILVMIFSVMLGTTLVNLAIRVFVGAPTGVGHHRLRLQILDGADAPIGTLFSAFGSCYWGSIGLWLLRAIYLFLWRLPATLMLWIAAASSVLTLVGMEVIPMALPETLAGWVIPWTVPALALLCAIAFAFLPLVARYRYAMSDFILAENPDTSPADALRQSALMMKGNKWRLFCLELSFIGWTILGMLTGGLLYIWMNPYLYQAEAAFYHEVSGRSAIRQAVSDTKVYMEGL